MQIGFVGLGKMGANMVERLLNNGHEVVVYNRHTEAIQAVAAKGAIPTRSLAEVAQKLTGRKAIWLMVPAGAAVDECIAGLQPFLQPDDIIIDGGNSMWRETQARSTRLLEQNLHLVDCGTSGGVWGLKNGYCLMFGGEANACEHLNPIFKTLAPENGYHYCGSSGSGHFVKMMHNGIEYGMMQAYAEGFEVMAKSPFDLDLTAISQIWQHGSVVRSWLLELIHAALKSDPQLDALQDYVQDSGEGRWAIQAAIDFDVPAAVITQALFTRFQSRQSESFAMKLVAAMRQQFGGHAVKEKP